MLSRTREGHRPLQLCERCLVELDLAGVGVRANVLGVAASGDRGRDARLMHRPCQGELGDRDAEPLGDRSHPVHDRQAVFPLAGTE
jgi:hypothetical protein